MFLRSFFLLILFCFNLHAEVTCDGITATKEEKKAYYDLLVTSRDISTQKYWDKYFSMRLTFLEEKMPHVAGDWNLLEDEEKLPIYSYTMSSRTLNDKLRADLPVDTLYFNMLCSALNHLPLFDPSVTLYRLVNLPLPVLENLKKTRTYHDAGFMSTSYDKQIGFVADTLFKIKAHTGRRIQAFSGHSSEREVLLPPGSDFNVISIKDFENPTHEDPKLIIELEQI